MSSNEFSGNMDPMEAVRLASGGSRKDEPVPSLVSVCDQPAYEAYDPAVESDDWLLMDSRLGTMDLFPVGDVHLTGALTLDPGYEFFFEEAPLDHSSTNPVVLDFSDDHPDLFQYGLETETFAEQLLQDITVQAPEDALTYFVATAQMPQTVQQDWDRTLGLDHDFGSLQLSGSQDFTVSPMAGDEVVIVEGNGWSQSLPITVSVAALQPSEIDTIVQMAKEFHQQDSDAEAESRLRDYLVSLRINRFP